MKKVLIYGIGKIGRGYIDDCLMQGVTGLTLADSARHLWGTEYRGIKIENPAEISWEDYDVIVIPANDENQLEIAERLATEYGVTEEKIVSYRETIVLSKKEVYNIGKMVFDDTLETGIIMTGRELGSKLKEDSMNELERFYFKKNHKCVNKWMHYFEAYDRFFSRYRKKDITILEIGVFKGGSLQMWKEYFQTENHKVQVYGIDIDPTCKKLEEDGIEIFIGSQEDREFLREIKKKIGKVDILIDDGGHTMKQQIISFEELFDLVDENGIYLCEDLHTSYMESYGGGYRGDSFIEYSKNFIDFINAQYSETEELVRNQYSDQIKFISYCDSMVFIEKKPKTTKSISVCV
ncbi:MAG: class I SAM-dependent methyltransferase [Lachnospiraceae bacterium]|nr:class I SAM-dependent methyltransferase [Lachnospiraceae bacterium]